MCIAGLVGIAEWVLGEWSEPWSNQTNDLNIDTCRFLARYSVLLGSDKDWLAQCGDNVTVWVIGSWYWWSGLSVGQHDKLSKFTESVTRR